eukprot:12417340-Karenia_brevis.AAC.1
MGPQSWPMLLLQVLQGKIPEATLKGKRQEAAAASKQEKLLKNETWTCSKCSPNVGDQTWKAYFVGGNTDEQDPRWKEKYSKYILKPGCKRECMACRGETDQCSMLKCDICKMHKPRASFG